jgi:hypothetical protein
MARWIEAVEAAQFKPVEGGYVFTAPSPLLFAAARRYRVNDMQKVAIAARMLHTRRVVVRYALAISLIFSLAAVAAAINLAPAGPTPGNLLIAAAAIVGGILLLIIPVQIYSTRAMAPLLVGLPQTAERITLRDRLETMAKVASYKYLVLQGLFWIMLGVLMVYNLFRYPDLSWLFIAVVALSAVDLGYFVYLAILKARLRRRAG